MKELSVEEKAQRYDEALKKAKDFYKGYKQRDNQLYADDLESIFPELKESEDERIRKELIDFLEYYRLNNVLDSKTISILTDSVAWLEKQGEQKPAWSEEDELIVAKILCICNDFERSFEIIPSSMKVIKEDVDKIDNWLKSLKDRCAWKPSDKQMDNK